MGKFHRTFFLLLTAALVCGCPPAEEQNQAPSSGTPFLRVLLVQDASQISLAATGDPVLSVGNDGSRVQLEMPAGEVVPVSILGGQWRMGMQSVGSGALKLSPPPDGLLSIDGTQYHGNVRLIPCDDGAHFNCINDVSIDDYLKGVLPRELYPKWEMQTYKAQAVVARTYALYIAHTEGLDRDWDLYSDTRSQVYGGVSAETEKSRAAAAETAGLVLTYGPSDGKIFMAYFSSDSGGVSQSAYDAFGEFNIPPLSARDDHEYGNISPHRNWGPVWITREDLTRRIRAWAARRLPPRAEQNMGLLANVQLAAVNAFGRPTEFRLTDIAGQMYVIRAEELRAAFDTDPIPGSTLPSSFCKVAVNGDYVVFYDGHGYGHGVGMSQWTAEDQAEHGMDYEAILDSAYPQVQFARAY